MLTFWHQIRHLIRLWNKHYFEKKLKINIRKLSNVKQQWFAIRHFRNLHVMAHINYCYAKETKNLYKCLKKNMLLTLILVLFLALLLPIPSFRIASGICSRRITGASNMNDVLPACSSTRITSNWEILFLFLNLKWLVGDRLGEPIQIGCGLVSNIDCDQ